MTSVNVTTQKNTVTVQQGDATTVTVATQGAQGATGATGATGAGISAGDKGALTVAANLTDWTLNDSIVTNANVSASAAIAGTKISPIFGSQNISTEGNFTINSASAAINLNDTEDNPDYRLTNSNGIFKIRDTTNSVDRFKINAIGDINISNTLIVTGNAIFGGNLTVSGTTTTIDTTTLRVEDKNIELGKVGSPTDITANEGGITLLGDTNHTFNWLNATDSWTSSEHIALPDNKKLQLGDSQDLQLFHDGSQSVILDNGTGQLRISGENTIALTNAAGTESYARFVANDTAQLFHDNVVRLSTTGIGVTVSGKITSTGDIIINNDYPVLAFLDTNNDSDYRLTNANGNFLLYDISNAATRFTVTNAGLLKVHGNVEPEADNTRALGSSSKRFTTLHSVDLNTDKAVTTSSGFNVIGTVIKLRNTANDADLVKIFHSGTGGNAIITSEIGNVKIQSAEDGGQVKLFATSSGTATEKLSTTGNGVIVSGNLFAGHLNAELDGNTSISLKDTGHGFSQSEIKLSNGGRDLNIVAPVDIRLFPMGGENGIVIEGNSAVELYHNNVKKAETSSTGLDVTGDVKASTGILFGSDTADDNKLQDYEEGTWTPTVVSEGNIGTPQYTCTYTKIGRLVTINADIHQLSDTTSDSHILIGGLPYVPTRTNGNWSAVCHGERYGFKDIIVAYLLYTGGAWRIGFRYGVPLNHFSYVKHTNISDTGDDNNLRFTLTYELAT